MPLLVQLLTSPPQQLQGFTDTFPLSAHSTATHPPTGPTPPLRAVNKWLNIPFATAARWGRPVPYTLPQEEAGAPRPCLEFGPNPFQGAGAVESLWVDKKEWLNRDFLGMAEDCLSANVFVPKEAGERAFREGKELPVMVWIYGGALATGHASAIRHDATELVRLAEKEGRPCIVVTGNYRLNIFGFCSHPDLDASDPDGLSGNYGFYDQLALLNWVQKHIHHFGGSASHVTAFGESAGAFSIAALASRDLSPSPSPVSPSPSSPSPSSSPSPLPLFHRAILQSGAPTTMHFRATPYPHWEALLKHFHLDDPALSPQDRVRGLRAVPAEELFQCGLKLGSGEGGWGGTLQSGGMWGLRAPEVRFEAGEWDRGVKEWVIGNNEDEGTLFVKVFPGDLHTPTGFADLLARSRDPALLTSHYPSPPDSTPTPSSQSLTSSPASHYLAYKLFLSPNEFLTRALARSSNPPTIRTYEFRARLPLMSPDDLGSHHGIEIPFVFGTRCFWKEGDGEDRTSEECMRRWSAIADDGSGQGTGPEWPVWTAEDPARLIIGPRGGEVHVERRELSELEQARHEYWCGEIRSGRGGLKP